MSDAQSAIDDLSRQLAQKAAEARVLQQVSSEINATLDLDEILEIVLRTMGELFGFRHALVLLLNETGDKLTVAASRGYGESGVGAEVPVGFGVIGVVAKKRKIMRTTNLGAQRAYAQAVRERMLQAGKASELGDQVPLPGLSDAECQIAIPMMIKDSLIGVFSVESPEPRAFSDREEVLATIVANQAASAINNAGLYRREAERRRELALAHDQLKELAQTLEDRVRERTRELEQTNRELRDTQAQLVQSGKMASLGQLVAGVAHELNTPIGSIRSSADLARRALEIVKTGLDEHPSQMQQKLVRAMSALEQACESEIIASERVTEIVRSLRNFARLDEAEEKRADLHDGILSTLTLLRHELKQGIQVETDFGKIPELLCHPNQLNQVFMNLMVNAVQAMEPPGKLMITTRETEGEVVLQFSDTGVGISDQNLPRIFDPGFTTKGVGVGTGLGLSICYKIIERHGGRIEVKSQEHEGSTFTLRLPVR